MILKILYLSKDKSSNVTELENDFSDIVEFKNN